MFLNIRRWRFDDFFCSQKKPPCRWQHQFTSSSAQLTACLRDLARHSKTDPTKTLAVCFGYPKTPCLRANDILHFLFF
jgi:hypothetical protein